MSFAPIARFTGHQGPVYALAAGDDGGTFLSGSGDRRVVRWDLRHPDQGVLLADAGQAVFSLFRSADLLLIGDEHGGLHLIDPRQGREVQLEQVHRKGIFALAPLPGGRLACAGGDGTLTLWSVSPSALVLQRRIPLCAEKLRGLSVSPDGAWLAVAGGDGAVRVLDTVDLNERHTLQAHPEGATCVAWHPHKPVLISGGKDGHLRLWHSDRGFALLLDLSAHSGPIYALAGDPAGTQFATASRDKTAKRWAADTFDVLQRLDRTAGGHTHSVNALAWLGDVLLTAGDDKRVIAWRTI